MFNMTYVMFHIVTWKDIVVKWNILCITTNYENKLSGYNKINSTEAHCIHWIRKKKLDTLSCNYKKRSHDYENVYEIR